MTNMAEEKALAVLQEITRNNTLDAAIKICAHFAAAGRSAAACGAGIREFKRMMNQPPTVDMSRMDCTNMPFHPPPDDEMDPAAAVWSTDASQGDYRRTWFLMTEIVIQLPGTPQGKGRPRFVRATGHAFTPSRTRSYESMLQDAAIEAMRGLGLMDGPVEVDVEAYFPVPVSWSKRKRQAALAGETRPAKKPDADNLLKVLDSLNAVVFRDDAQIVEASVAKYYSAAPRLVVKVRAA